MLATLKPAERFATNFDDVKCPVCGKPWGAHDDSTHCHRLRPAGGPAYDPMLEMEDRGRAEAVRKGVGS